MGVLFLKTLGASKFLLENKFFKYAVPITSVYTYSRKGLYLLLLEIILASGFEIIIKYITSQTKYLNDDLLDARVFKKNGLDTYFSYYKYTNNIELYPTSKIISKQVNYTLPQLELVIKVLGNNMEIDDYMNLQIYATREEAGLFKSEVDYHDNRLLAIGNLYSEPNKFKEIVKIYNEGKLQTVVYSYFYENGILKFSEYLKLHNIEHTIYEPSLSTELKDKYLLDFKNKKIKILLLHPGYYHGLSISGCNIFHILEPSTNVSKYEQLITRVIRFKSHSHLPVSERFVNIYEWSCTLVNDINKISHMEVAFQVYQNSKEVTKTILQLLDLVKGIMSPDDLHKSWENWDKNATKNAVDLLKDISIDDNTLDNTCNILMPPGNKINKKIKPCVKKQK